jgi:hypothetical protein
LAEGISPLSAAATFLENPSPGRRRQLDSGAACLGESNGNSLFGGSGAVFARANMVHLFTDEHTGLSGRGFALGFFPPGPFDSFFSGI